MCGRRSRTWWVIAATACSVDGPLDALDDPSLIATFQERHARVYDVWQAPLDADAVHDVLDDAFHGDALTRQYVEHWTTRVQLDRAGTSIDVKQVSHEPTVVLTRGPEAATLDARWSVGGIVRHESHSHPRVNRYAAVYTVAWVEDDLRIVHTRLRGAERVRDLLSQTGSEWILDDLPTSDGGFLDAADLLEAELREGGGEPTPGSSR